MCVLVVGCIIQFGLSQLIRELGRGGLAGAVVKDFAIVPIEDDFVEWCGAFDGGPANLCLATGRIVLQIHSRKERRCLVILILGPSFKRMVMALVAVKADGEK